MQDKAIREEKKNGGYRTHKQPEAKDDDHAEVGDSRERHVAGTELR